MTEPEVPPFIGRTFTVNIDLDTKCKRCGAPGATDSGFCLQCAADALQAGYTHPQIAYEKSLTFRSRELCLARRRAKRRKR